MIKVLCVLDSIVNGTSIARLLQSEKVSLVQIAYDTNVWLLRLNKFDKNSLPSSLKILLQSEAIMKIGRAVSDDLKKLERDFGLEESHGKLELGNYCKNKGAINKASYGLEYICAVVLKRSYQKTAIHLKYDYRKNDG
ncbi:hypothetical protein INT47_013033 [Mucor saturninus]|uniref:Uncharacterized protein n=1 Tax=Mucor saturninus TaxID=64648 RepID=A0A8H7QZM7_9FUNG|nr:hypothetical protein INT47_013033 [Mucor saturninus]